MCDEKAYIQIYTGNGKGKTTASLGLVVRAVGAGFKVWYGQFLKKGEYSELEVLKRLEDSICVRQFGTGKFIKGLPSDTDILNAEKGFEEAVSAVQSGKYKLVVLDEFCTVVGMGLVSLERALSFLSRSAKETASEIVLTGRNAPEELIAAADLVTEMREIKHYYTNGVNARKGIEC